MTKTKWLLATIDGTIPEIAERINSRQFTKETSAGFDLLEVQRSKIRGKFIEEVITTEVVVTPFGEEVTNSSLRYVTFEFLLTPFRKGQFLIRVMDPTRSLKNFVDLLSEVLEFGFAVESLKIDIPTLVQHLRAANVAQSIRIKKIRLANVAIGKSTISKIDAVSNVDVLQDVRRNLSIRDSNLERATLEVRRESISTDIEMTCAGLICGDISTLEDLMPAFSSYFTSRS